MAKAKGRFSRYLSATVAVGLVLDRLIRRSRPKKEPSSERAQPGESLPPAPKTVASSERSQPTPSARNAGKFQWIRKAVSRFVDDNCTTMAAATAYYTTFSIAPLLLIIISVVGLVFGHEAVQHQIQSQIQGLIGKGAAMQIGAMVQNAAGHSSTGILGAALGVIALIFGATGAFTQLQSSLNEVWHVKPDPR